MSTNGIIARSTGEGTCSAKFKPNIFDHRSDGTTRIVLERKDGTTMDCVIDTNDYDTVKRHRWSAREQRNGRFYAQTMIRNEKGQKRILMMHRLLLPDSVEAEHENNNGLDNRRSRNLRSATRMQNAANISKRRTGGTSKFKGVHWCTTKKRWIAKIRVNYKRLSLGSFNSESDAAKAYDAAATEHFGNFANLNFPKTEAA